MPQCARILLWFISYVLILSRLPPAAALSMYVRMYVCIYVHIHTLHKENQNRKAAVVMFPALVSNIPTIFAQGFYHQ
jgi:hypothetical protein